MRRHILDIRHIHTGVAIRVCHRGTLRHSHPLDEDRRLCHLQDDSPINNGDGVRYRFGLSYLGDDVGDSHHG